MKTRPRLFLLRLALLPLLVFGLVAQEAPPAPAAPEAAAPAQPAPAVAPAPAAPAANEAAAPTEKAAAPVEAETPATTDRPLRRLAPMRSRGGDRVRVMDDNHVAADSRIAGNIVTVLGDAEVAGEGRRNLVTVLGDCSLDGTIERDVVCVLGDLRINGTVHGKVVSVLGDVTLGPKAQVDGEIIARGGEVHRAAGARVRGEISEQGDNVDISPQLAAWWHHGLSIGRPLAVRPELHWLWVFTAAMVVFYFLLALVFPGGVRKCGDALVQRPGVTILASFLGLLALPFVFVLLVITIVGIPVAFVCLPLGVIGASLFGRVAIYSLVGRAMSGGRLHPAFGLLVGVAVFLLLYLTPAIGLALWLLVALLGFGCVTAVLFTPRGTVAPAGGPVMPAAVPVAPMMAAEIPAMAPPPGALPPPVVQATALATLPRAGFWVRLGALTLDVVLVVVLTAWLVGPFWMPILAAYGAVMWKLRGTTIGGIICGIRVVRLDGREIDWPTAIVRAVGSFLSIAVVGLGFIWVAFDDERQSWHDKVAGTTVVRMPKGISLV